MTGEHDMMVVPEKPEGAAVPKPPHPAGTRGHWLRAYRDLVFIRWTNIRNEWYFGVIVGMLFPVAIMTFMRLSGSTTDPQAGLYVASGNAVMSLVMGPMQSLCNDLAWARQRNDLDYFAALPVTKLQVTLAYTTVSGVFIIPGMLFSIGIGSWWFGFPVQWNPLTLPVMVLASLSMAGLGVMAGLHARGIHQANMFNSAVMLVTVFLSPVLLPYENLPKFLQVTSKLLPTSYAAAALRGSLSGMPMPELVKYLGILCAFTAGFLYIGTKRLDWRLD
ncbi:MAG: ABC transporter permease [Bacillota bacterium]|nr:ABC transporter permease [Candidatus Fermentithermobacillaceae bacterium]